MKRILVIEDEPQMLLGLRDNLELEGYEVQTAADGEQGLIKAAAFNPDLVILDLMLPKKNGFDVCRELRERSAATSIVMLTARSAETDKVLGLELGADDYVTKPFSITELLARVRAVLRRADGRRSSGVVRVGDLTLDPASRAVRLSGRRVELAAKEFALLHALAQEPTRVYGKQELLRDVWGFLSPGNTRTLDAHACRLRRKLHPSTRPWVVNVRGIGYKLTESV
jgi:DNA-binding response OmpR family regulator